MATKVLMAVAGSGAPSAEKEVVSERMCGREREREGVGMDTTTHTHAPPHTPSAAGSAATCQSSITDPGRTFATETREAETLTKPVHVFFEMNVRDYAS